MVTAMIVLDEYEDRVINIVKAKYGFKNKSEAVQYIIRQFESEFLEPELKPEFIERMEARRREPLVEIGDPEEHFGLDDDA